MFGWASPRCEGRGTCLRWRQAGARRPSGHLPRQERHDIGEVGGLPDAAEGRADQTKANLKQAAEKVKDAPRPPAADPPG